MNKNYITQRCHSKAAKSGHLRKTGLFTLLALLGMLPMARVFAQSTVLISPTVNNGGFESGTTGWTFSGGGQTNYWVVGSGNYFSGTQAAYITNSTTQPYDYNYDNTASSVSQMYMDVTFPAGQPVVTLTFAVDCFGEYGFGTPFDVLDVSLAPTSVTPIAGTAINDAAGGAGSVGPYSLTSDYIGNVNGWHTISIVIPQSLIGNTSTAVTRRLIFEWQNDNGGGSEPAAIDDITLTSSCQGPVVTGPSPVTSTSATVNWNAVPGATSYNVRYKLTTDPTTVSTWTNPINVSGTSAVLSPLLPNQTQYDYEVSAVGGACDAYSLDDTFQTLCNISLPYLETFEGIVSDNDLPTCMSATNIGNDVYTYSSSGNAPNSGMSNHTPGGDKFAAFGGGYITIDDYIFTPAFNLQAGNTYQFTFWYDAMGNTDWGTLAAYYGNNNTPAAMTNLIGEVNAPDNNGYIKFTGNFTPATSGVYNVGIYCNGYSAYEFLDIDDIGLTLLPPCAGMPDAGNVTPAGPLSSCTGSTIALSNDGPAVSGATYQWQMSTISNPAWVDVPGATTPDFTSPVLSDTSYFRLIEKCLVSGLIDTTAPVTVNVPKPVYATLPAVEDFENWVDRCNSLDVPSYSWTNQPAHGENSWRRDDQGGTDGGWSYSNGGSYAPVSYHAAHSARFHSEGANYGLTGTMDYYVDCSSVPGTKELQFYSINASDFSNGDFLTVQYSTNGAAGPFTDLGEADVNDSWTLYTFPLPTNSPTVVIRFIGNSDYGSTDIGLDYVRVLSPCAGAPTAGTVTATNACSGVDFTLGVQGNSQAGGLTYQWQQSADSIIWTNIAGATADQTVGNITTPTYFRLIVTCSNSTMSDTSAGLLVNLAPYYYCYCTSAAQYNGYNSNIGNVNIVTQPGGTTVLDNGDPNPQFNNSSAVSPYTDFTALTPAVIYKNSTYTASVTAVSTESYLIDSRSAIYVDYNHDGVYDVTTEKLITVNNNSSSGVASADFTVPPTAMTGITGMRVILENYGTGTLNPCGLYGEGETEDYIIDIEPQPCTGAANAGTAIISDTSICFGYAVDLMDATHDTAYGGLTWTWEQSGDGGATWNTVPASAGLDTVYNVPIAGPSQFRLAINCVNSGITSYSNVVTVNIKPANICYCTSIATGGAAADSSDITSFSIGNFVMAGSGPHLYNPTATRGRTDYTNLPPIQLPADSTVGMSVYQTMLRGNHADGRVTVFIDYNNNHVYDIPSERVWTGFTTLQVGFEATSIYIPANVVLNTPTGLRVIANNNVNPNTPSDDACGTYTSGETEDYLVMFHQPTTGIGNVTNIQSLQLYPNPTTGTVNLQMNMQKAVSDLQIVVTNITGQQIATRTFHNTGTQFNTQLDLSGEARGVYFIEIKADGDRSLQRVTLK